MAEVRTYSTPGKLYRYRSLPDKKHLEREIEAIAAGYIYCPQYTAMNDPMEGRHRESIAYIIRGAKRERAKVAAEKEKLGIASLSEIFDHEPMWAHYAGQFSGICISYSAARLLKNLPSSVDLVRMNYNEEAPVLLSTKKSVLDKAKLTLASKTVRWASEREWRLINPQHGPALYKKLDCVVSVRLGSRIDRVHEVFIRKEMAALKIPVLKMAINKYKIDFSKMASEYCNLVSIMGPRVQS